METYTTIFERFREKSSERGNQSEFKFRGVLAVDDEPKVPRMWKRSLRRYLVSDVKFDIVENVEEVRELYDGPKAEGKYDIVLLDGLEGRCFEVYDTIREYDVDVPIVLHTTDYNLKMESEKRDLGMLYWEKTDMKKLFENLTKLSNDIK